MTQRARPLTEPSRSELVRRNVAAALEAVLDARVQVPELRRIFEHSRVPMVMTDGRPRIVEINHTARLWFRLNRDEMRTFAIGDVTPADPPGGIELAWSRLLEVGRVEGRYPAYAPDGSRLDLVYCGVAHIVPGLHLIAFAPADWPAPEFDAITDDRHEASAALTPREIELLALAANGLTGPDLAQQLFISPATVRSHVANIYAKLGVRTRAAAVAKALRLGVIQ
jgi:DNA-binding CsgD family transcriptional regulator